MTPSEFIQLLLPHAIVVQRRYGLPAAAMIAQAALETGWGSAVLQRPDGQSSHNLFNIKGEGPAGTVEVRAWEHVNGQDVSVPSRFRCYRSYEESFADYAQLIAGSARYATAYADSNNPVAYVEALAMAGYATDPSYASKVISIMDDFDLIETAERALHSTPTAQIGEVTIEARMIDGVMWVPLRAIVEAMNKLTRRVDYIAIGNRAYVR